MMRMIHIFNKNKSHQSTHKTHTTYTFHLMRREFKPVRGTGFYLQTHVS